MQKKAPLLSLRPQFDPGLAMVQALGVTVAGTVVLTVAGGTLFYVLIMIFGLGRFVPAGWVYGLFFVGSLVVLPPYFYELKKRAYLRTVYNFYEDYVDFQSFKFYLNPRRGRVRYRDIADIVQQASTLQDQRRLTNIYLSVPSMGLGRSGFSGVQISDVPVAAGHATRIMDIVERGLLSPDKAAAGVVNA